MRHATIKKTLRPMTGVLAWRSVRKRTNVNHRVRSRVRERQTSAKIGAALDFPDRRGAHGAATVGSKNKTRRMAVHRGAGGR